MRRHLVFERLQLGRRIIGDQLHLLPDTLAQRYRCGIARD